MTCIEEINRFLDRYKALKFSLYDDIVNSFKERFKLLHDNMAPFMKKYHTYLKEESPHFNIFRLLKVEDDEVKTHSAMLAYLLDPHADHYQKHLFLEEFINIAGLQIPKKAFTEGCWFVETEKYTPNGRLDIVISCPNLKYLIMIENKIYAREQDNQLGRYWECMESMKREYTTRQLIYLNLDGKESFTAKGIDYITMSYYDDVSQMIDNCINKINAWSLNVILQQYKNLINRL